MSACTVAKPIIFVVDADPLARYGVKALVESVDLECETFWSPRACLLRSQSSIPSCVILDVRLPEMNGLDLQAQLERISKSIRTIILTGHGDIPMCVRAMKSGAVDFLTKPSRDPDLLDAIRRALEQHRAYSRREQQFADLFDRFQGLDARERKILPLVTAGLLNKQIAAEIGLSEVRTKFIRSSMMTKMQARTVPDLVRMAEALKPPLRGWGP